MSHENKPNLRRLATLALYLRKIPVKKFHIQYWIAKGPGVVSISPPDLHECGSVACAGGHACFIPSFRRAGLRMRRGAPSLWEGDSSSRTGADVLGDFFSLSPECVGNFFYPDKYPRGINTTAKEVARRIENFIKKTRKQTLRAGAR